MSQLCLPTSSLRKGDLLDFWGTQGIFLRDVTQEVDDVSISMVLDPNTMGSIVRISFYLDGERKISELRCSHELKFQPFIEQFSFISLLVDNEMSILPRLEFMERFVDDGLRVLSRIEECEG